MSCSAYLDSAAFNLERESNANGGFGKSSQELAQGIGREKVTGILPLYLFDEHWEISKRTIPSIFGFMCTLDIMGYASDQFFIIPYTVLCACYEKYFQNKSDINEKMLRVVKATCIQIIKRHETHAERIIDALKAFQESPSGRTKDCIPNFRVFIAQILSAIEAGVLDKSKDFDWMKIIRFLVEEHARRLLPKNHEIPTRRQQTNFYNDKTTSNIVDQAMKIKGLSADMVLSPEEIMHKLSGGTEEEKKNLEAEDNIKTLLDEEIGKQHWYKQLEDPTHKNSMHVSSFSKALSKHLLWVKVFIDQLNLDSMPVPTLVTELECFKEPVL
jgi:hypothetical protein